MMVFSSLDIIEYKEIHKKSKSSNNSDDYIGMLMPFYENNFDLATYGYIGNNGFKLICIKKIENSLQEVSSELKLKEVIIFYSYILVSFYECFIFSQKRLKSIEVTR